MPPSFFGLRQKRESTLLSDNSKLDILFSDHRRHVLHIEARDLLSQNVLTPAFLLVWGCIKAWVMGNLYIWNSIINAGKYFQVLTKCMLPSRHLFQKGPTHFSKTTLNFLLRSSQQHDSSIMKQKVQQNRARAVEQLQSCIRQEWDNPPVPPAGL